MDGTEYNGGVLIVAWIATVVAAHFV